MAQAPEISDTFLREVDENVRRDQLRDFVKAYAGWLVAAVVLFLAACGGYIWYQQHREKRTQEEVEQLAQIYKDIGNGNNAKVPQQLDALSKAGSKAVRASALFTRAAVAIQDNDLKLATATYKNIAIDGGMPQPYRDAALIRETALEFDQLQPQDVINRLQALATPGNPWFGSAAEMTALALIKQGKTAEAGHLFVTIAKDKDAPDSLRARAVQIAGSLGADASAVLPPPAQ